MTDGHSPSIHCKTEFRWGRGLAVVWLAVATFAAVSAIGAGHRARPDQLQRGQASECGHAASGTHRRGDSEARVRADARLPAVSAPLARSARVVAGARLLENEHAARTDLAAHSSRDLLQRRGDGWLLSSWTGDRGIGGGRSHRHGVLHARPGARSEGGSAASDRLLPALSQLVEPTRAFPGISSVPSSWTRTGIRCLPAARSAPITTVRSPSGGEAGT